MFPEFRTSNFIFRLMHDVIFSPILRVTPVTLGVSAARLRALVARFSTSV